MKYLGGKSKNCKLIAGYINSLRREGVQYIEPFVGGGWVLEQIDAGNSGGVLACDIHKSLILLWRALQDDWIPPDEISEEDYDLVRSEGGESALRAFVGFCCSYGGKYWASYARGTNSEDNGGRGYAREGKEGCLRKICNIAKMVGGCEFICVPYWRLKPTKGSVIYCDPPYGGTTEYNSLGRFNTELFWSVVGEWVKKGCIVLVSEEVAPVGWQTIWMRKIKQSVRSELQYAAKIRTEKLFMHKSQIHLLSKRDLCFGSSIGELDDISEQVAGEKVGHREDKANRVLTIGNRS